MVETGYERPKPRAQLTADLFEGLFAGCTGETYRAGHHLFMQDDLSDRVYGVMAGAVEIAIYSESGRKLVANLETEKCVFGEIGALDGGVRTATATCLTDAVLVSLSRRQLIDRIQQNPKLATTMIWLLCARLRYVSAELGDQALLNIEARLAKRLSFLSSLIEDDGGWIHISQSDLAEFLGATRESVNKTLTYMRKGGVIDVKRGAVKILNARALERIGAGPDD
jgi:CRP/FNR family transcriptional regulator, cyclic AMP receptor protein